MAELIYWTCLLLPVYAYLGYPLMLSLLVPLFPVRHYGRALPMDVSIVIAAHNEARHIEDKLRTLLAQDYRAHSLRIILVSDGSTDDTVARAHRVVDPRISVLDLPRQGKAAALNAGVAHSSGEILVFTDADNQWSYDTLRHLLAPLGDPEVGACAGHMEIPIPGAGLSLGDSLYRHYEGWLRRVESRTDCMVSADGALLALRRELFEPIPAQVNDDFFLSTCAPAAGKSIVYVPQARVTDQGVDEADKQFRRRQRVTVGGLLSLAHRRALLNPLRHGLYAIALMSHKLIRRLAPVLLLPLLLSNAWLWDDHLFYRLTLAGQLFGYAMAMIGLLDRRHRLPRPFRLAAFVLVTMTGMSLGLWQFLRGQRYSQWNPEQNR
ncbi:glycosyltransferase family 2 protein [Pseudomonas uvaldensis]|uniref:glycosyltransferase family 2 protein n=1 Tax=Pseudomonas uvaldensis TaxID=2878385 RepID=UPI001E2F3B48|nr:glycosyltransferase family 2 protein [Pseudomonas uvaldensis]